MIKVLALTAVAVAIAVALVTVWPMRAKAAECEQVDTVVARVVAAGGELVDLVDIPGKSADQMVLFDVGGKIIAGLVVKGCLTGLPMVLAESRGDGTPA